MYTYQCPWNRINKSLHPQKDTKWMVVSNFGANTFNPFIRFYTTGYPTNIYSSTTGAKKWCHCAIWRISPQSPNLQSFEHQQYKTVHICPVSLNQKSNRPFLVRQPLDSQQTIQVHKFGKFIFFWRNTEKKREISLNLGNLSFTLQSELCPDRKSKTLKKIKNAI